MESLSQYGLFLAETVTLVSAAIAVIFFMVVMGEKGKRAPGHLEIKKLNEKYEVYQRVLNSTTLPKGHAKRLHKQHKHEMKEQEKQAKHLELAPKRVFVMDFSGDIRASEVQTLREEITAVLTTATATDEVLVRLESPGGMVHAYGLAASQLLRIREAGIPLTVAVDKVAASGGYLMACVANRIIAAPFAILGSIGVVAQVPNFNRLLKKHDIDFELVTAGEYKRTLTLFGENTDKAREKFREDMEDVHLVFKEFISRYRPEVDIAQVATGEHWLALRAQPLKLVDAIQTSDDYLAGLAKDCGIFEVDYIIKKPITARLGMAVQKSLDKVLYHHANHSNQS